MENGAESSDDDISAVHDVIDLSNAEDTHSDTKPITIDFDDQPVASTSNPPNKFVVVEDHKVIRKIHDKLFDYQKEGLRLMIALFNKQKKGDKLAKGCRRHGVSSQAILIFHL